MYWQSKHHEPRKYQAVTGRAMHNKSKHPSGRRSSLTCTWLSEYPRPCCVLVLRGPYWTGPNTGINSINSEICYRTWQVLPGIYYVPPEIVGATTDALVWKLMWEEQHTQQIVRISIILAHHPVYFSLPLRSQWCSKIVLRLFSLFYPPIAGEHS